LPRLVGNGTIRGKRRATVKRGGRHRGDGAENVEVVDYHSGRKRTVVRHAPIRPGEILADELAELGLSAAALARLLDVPANRELQILTASVR
jgi:hypothetical protein